MFFNESHGITKHTKPSKVTGDLGFLEDLPREFPKETTALNKGEGFAIQVCFINR